jgi:hypothetical protein
MGLAFVTKDELDRSAFDFGAGGFVGLTALLGMARRG